MLHGRVPGLAVVLPFGCARLPMSKHVFEKRPPKHTCNMSKVFGQVVLIRTHTVQYYGDDGKTNKKHKQLGKNNYLNIHLNNLFQVPYDATIYAYL